MDTRNLVKMANQIGDFFASFPDREEASGEVANHLRKFWPPHMRSQLLQHVDKSDGEGLSDIVLSSIRMHKDRL